MSQAAPTTSAPEAGLRARKRAATFDAIERAAIALVLEHGYDSVTIDMICDATTVSQRTFFNYFGSKEAVILGTNRAKAPDDARYAFIHEPGAHVLGDLVELITAALLSHDPDPQLMRHRREIIHCTPELAQKEMARMHAAEDDLVALIMERFTAQGRSTDATPDLAEEARMIVALTTGVTHSMMCQWYASDFTTSPGELLRNSINLVRRVTQTA